MKVQKVVKGLLLAVPALFLATFSLLPTAQQTDASREVAPSTGWAGQNGGTRGGADAASNRVYEVRTRTQLIAAIKEAGTTPKIIKIAGTIDMTEGTPFASSGDQSNRGQIKPLSNTTVIGEGNDARIINGFFKINGQTNVILRNFTMQNPCDIATKYDPNDGVNGSYNAAYDGVTIDASKNIWVDHVVFTDEPITNDKLPQENGVLKECHDGALDVKNASDFVTISNNIFKLHAKNSIVGHKDGNTADRGHLTVTWTGNLFQDVESRTPRVRFGMVHVYNNAYVGSKTHPVYPHEYSIGVGVESKVISENNVFNITGAATCDAIVKNWGGTIFVDRGSLLNGAVFNATPCGYSAAAGWTPPYTYTLQPASQVLASVLANAGVGKLTVLSGGGTSGSGSSSSSSGSSSSSSGGVLLTMPGVKCAEVGQFCSFSGTRTVQMGYCIGFVNDGGCSKSIPVTATNGIQCDPANFGGFNSGACYLPASDGSSSSSSSSTSSSGGVPLTMPGVKCAEIGQFCAFSGTGTVEMGYCIGFVNDGMCNKSRPVTATDGIQCDPANFGGTNFGACYVRVQFTGNLALNAASSASSQSSSSRSAAMVNDGNESTRWEASNSSAGSWVQINLGAAKSVKSVTLKEYANRIAGFRIEYLNGATWSTLATGTTIGSAKSISFTPVTTTAVRLITSVSSSGQPSLNEFEVY